MNSRGLVFTIEALLGLVLICGIILALTWVPMSIEGHQELHAQALAATSSYTHVSTPTPPATLNPIYCVHSVRITTTPTITSGDYCSD